MHENSIETILKAQNGDKDEMAKLVEDNQGLIWSIVKRFLGRGYDKEDIYQIGCLGFIKAIRRFDSEYDVKLSTYAVPYILGEIKKFLRDDGPVKVSRGLHDLNIKIAELQKEYIKKGKELNVLEIANILKIPKEEVAMALEARNPAESIESNIYNKDGSNKELTVMERLASHETISVTDRIAIRDLIQNLNDRDKEIILLRFYKDKTQSEVAKILGISQVQVSRIEKKILAGMKAELVS